MAVHAGLVVAGDQAGEVEAACAVEAPDQLFGLARGHMGHIGFGMLHAGVLQHHLRVLVQRVPGAQHHLVHDLALVDHAQAHGFALLHLKWSG
jgi:hypothetical protein